MTSRTVYYTDPALADMTRLHDFLRLKSRRAADRAVTTIREAVIRLSEFPESGRGAGDLDPSHRELIVRFAKSGYVVLYGFDDGDVIVVSIRHQREAGY